MSTYDEDYDFPTDPLLWEPDPANDAPAVLPGDFDLPQLRQRRARLAQRTGVKSTPTAIACRNRERGGINAKITKAQIRLRNYRRRLVELRRLQTFDDEISALDTQIQECEQQARRNAVPPEGEGEGCGEGDGEYGEYDEYDAPEGPPELEPVPVPGGIPPAPMLP